MSEVKQNKMKTKRVILGVSCIFAFVYACAPGPKQIPTPSPTPSPTAIKSVGEITPPTATREPGNSEGFFIASDFVSEVPPDSFIARNRFVTLDRSILLNKNDKARKLEPGFELALNLFDDTIYTVVIEEVEKDAGMISWIGYLKDIEVSSFILIYTADIFIGNFGSPAGIYEVAHVRDGVYQITLIDQSQLNEVEGDPQY